MPAAFVKKIVLVLACCVPLLGAGVALTLGARGVDRRPPTAPERELLVPAGALQALGLTELDPGAGETWLAKRNIDGTLELEYEYDSDRVPGAPYYLFYKSEAEINDDVQSAHESLALQFAAYELGASTVDGRELVRDDTLVTLGHEHISARIEENGATAGVALVIRQDHVVHSFLLFAERLPPFERLDELVAPALQRSSATSGKRAER